VMLIYDVRPTFPLAQGIREDEWKVIGIRASVKFCSLQKLNSDHI
jgi:hypothetical protein